MGERPAAPGDHPVLARVGTLTERQEPTRPRAGYRSSGAEESGDGYHCYPSRAQVGHWLEEGMLVVVAEDDSPGDGYGYLHLLARAG